MPTSRERKALKLDLGNLTEKNMGQLKKLNTATFPVKYKDQFYLDLVKYFDYCRLGFYADVLVGSICCRLEDREDGGKALYIMTLSILEPYRKRNLASQLVQWILDRAQSKECQEKDVREIYLHVQTSNKTALQFYKKFGFKVTEKICDYYHNIDPPDCYVLRARHKDTSHNTCEGRHPCCRHVGWLRWSAVARLRLLPRDQDAGHDAGHAGPDADDAGPEREGTCHGTCHGTDCGVLVPPDGHETHPAHVGACTAADAGAKLCLDGVSGSTAGAWMARATRATRTTTRSRWPRSSGFSAWTTHSSLCTHPDT